MDNRDAPFRVQPGDGTSYTLDEYLALIEPQYREHRAVMHKCITGLTQYAARLAAQRQEEQIPQLRRLCIEISEFWGLTEDDTARGYREMVQKYTGTFDQAVSASRISGHAPDMTEQAKKDILAGLDLYAQEMRCNGPEMEQWATECDVLAETLEEQWQADAALHQQTGLRMEGM